MPDEKDVAEQTSRRKGGCLGCGLKVVGLAVVLLAIAALSLQYLIPTEWIRQQIIEHVKTTTGRECKLGSVSINLTGGVTVNDFEVSSKTAGESPLLKVKRLSLNASYSDLLKSPPRITSISLSGAEVYVTVDKDGKYNFDDLLAERETESESERFIPLSDARGGGGTPTFAIEEAVISDSRIIYKDLAAGTESRLDIRKVKLGCADFNDKISVDGDVSPSGKEDVIRLKGELDLLDNYGFDPAGTANLKFMAKDFNIASLAVLGVDEINGIKLAGGKATGDAAFSFKNGSSEIKPTGMAFQKLLLSSVDLSKPLEIPQMNADGLLKIGEKWDKLELAGVVLKSDVATIKLDGFVGLGDNSDGNIGFSAPVNLSPLASILKNGGMGGALPSNIAGQLEVEGVLKYSADSFEPDITLKGGQVSIPVAKAKGNLLISPRGKARAVMSDTKTLLNLNLSACDISVPETPTALAFPATAKGALLLDVKLDRLDLKDLDVRALDSKGKAGLALLLNGKVDSVTGGEPQVDLIVDGECSLQQLSPVIKVTPFEGKSHGKGDIRVNARALINHNGFAVAPAEKDKPVLWSLDEVVLLELAKDIKELQLGRINLYAGEIRYDLAKDLISASGIKLDSAPLSAAVSILAKPVEGVYSAGYGIALNGENFKLCLKDVLSGDLPLEVSSLQGTVVCKPDSVQFSKTAIVGRLLEGDKTYNARLAHDMKIIFKDGLTQEVLPEAVSLVLGDPQNKGKTVFSVSVGKDARVTAPWGSPNINVNGAMQGDTSVVQSLLVSLGKYIPSLRPSLASVAGYGVKSSSLVNFSITDDEQKQSATASMAFNNIDIFDSDGLKLFSDPQLRGEIKAHWSPDWKNITLDSAAFATRQDRLVFSGKGSIETAPDGKNWLIDKSTVFNLSVDGGAVGRSFPGLVSPGVSMSGKAISRVAVSGRSDALSCDASASFNEFTVNRLNSSPIYLAKTRAGISGILNLAKPVGKDSAKQNNPYGYMETFDFSQGKLAVDEFRIGEKPVRNITSSFALLNGVLGIDKWMSAEVGGKDGKAVCGGMIDFSKVPVECSFSARAPVIDLATGVGRVENYFTVSSGTLHVPDGDSGKDITASWRGFEYPIMRKSLNLENGSFRATDVMVDDIQPGNFMGLLSILNRLNLDFVAKAQEKLDERNYEYGSVSGKFESVLGLVKLDVYVVGKNTADFLIKGDVNSSDELDLRVYLIKNVHRSLEIDDLAKAAANFPLLKNADEDTLKRQLPEVMEKLGNQKKLSFKIEGTIDSPKTTGVDKMVREILLATAKTAGAKIGESIIEGLRKSNEERKKDGKNDGKDDGKINADDLAKDLLKKLF